LRLHSRRRGIATPWQCPAASLVRAAAPQPPSATGSTQRQARRRDRARPRPCRAHRHKRVAAGSGRPTRGHGRRVLEPPRGRTLPVKVDPVSAENTVSVFLRRRVHVRCFTRARGYEIASNVARGSPCACRELDSLDEDGSGRCGSNTTRSIPTGRGVTSTRARRQRSSATGYAASSYSWSSPASRSRRRRRSSGSC
jgi:hypothetical protein